MNTKLKLTLKIIAIVIIGLAIIMIGVSAIRAKTYEIKNPIVTIEVENYGTVKMELYPEYAPNTVSNFVKLVENGYFNNKVVYGKDDMCLYLGRNSEGNVDDPTLNDIDPNIEAGSEKDVKYSIFGEFVANGFEKNSLRHEKYVVTMVRSDYTSQLPDLVDESYNSATSQFGVIMNSEGARNLNGIYAAFGRIIEGTEIIDKIYNENPVKVSEEEGETSLSVFETFPVITSVTVETFGCDYGMPKVESFFDYQEYINELISQYYQTQVTEE